MYFIAAEPDQWHLNVNPAIQNSDGYDFHAFEIILYSVQLLPVRWRRGEEKWNVLSMCSEPVFVDLLRRPGIDSRPGGPVRNPICLTGPPGYM